MSASTAAVGGDVGTGQRQRQLTLACHKFNNSPEVGVAHLRQHGLLPESAQGMAEFLRTTEGLSKKAIGLFFGEPESYNQEVLAAFVRQHDFSGQSVLPAQRQLLTSFLLPGESQKINRVTTCFAQHYCHLNPVAFAHADDCATLCGALLLLNTLLHNPSVRERPNVERFVEMVRQTGRAVLPRSQLETMYNSVKAQPFQVPTDVVLNDLTLSLRHPQRSGWLYKQCRRFNAWQWRWFVLEENCLYYFAEKDDAQPLGVVPLVNIRIRVALEKCKKHCFELYSDADVVVASERLRGFCGRQVVPGKHASYRLAASTVQNMTEWMQAITTSIVQDPKPTATHSTQTAGHRPA